jgi:hypothetical protein
MKSRFSRLRVLCEDQRTQIFIENLATRFGIGSRHIKFDISPRSSEDASKYVLDNFVEAVKQWRAARHGHEMIAFLVVIDGDKHGVVRRRNELLQRLRDSGAKPIAQNDPVAIIVPTWHIETWIAWLCGHRPIDERTRYNGRDPAGLDVHHKIKQRTYNTEAAIAAWNPPAAEESVHVPSLADARRELTERFGF